MSAYTDWQHVCASHGSAYVPSICARIPPNPPNEFLHPISAFGWYLGDAVATALGDAGAWLINVATTQTTLSVWQSGAFQGLELVMQVFGAAVGRVSLLVLLVRALLAASGRGEPIEESLRRILVQPATTVVAASPTLPGWAIGQLVVAAGQLAGALWQAGIHGIIGGTLAAHGPLAAEGGAALGAVLAAWALVALTGSGGVLLGTLLVLVAVALVISASILAVAIAGTLVAPVAIALALHPIGRRWGGLVLELLVGVVLVESLLVLFLPAGLAILLAPLSVRQISFTSEITSLALVLAPVVGGAKTVHKLATLTIGALHHSAGTLVTSSASDLASGYAAEVTPGGLTSKLLGVEGPFGRHGRALARAFGLAVPAPQVSPVDAAPNPPVASDGADPEQGSSPSGPLQARGPPRMQRPPTSPAPRSPDQGGFGTSSEPSGHDVEDADAVAQVVLAKAMAPPPAEPRAASNSGTNTGTTRSAGQADQEGEANASNM